MTQKKRSERETLPQKAGKLIVELGDKIYTQLSNLEPPAVSIPSRSIDNIVFDERLQQYVLGHKSIRRGFSNVRGAKGLAQLLWVAYVANELIKSDQVTTLRDLYYTSLNEKMLEIKEQAETDSQVEDLEAILSVPRETFNIIPHDRGTAFGRLVLEYTIKGFQGNRVDLMSHPD